MVAGRVLCLDFGSKRVGVAMSDETATLASPLEILAAENLSTLLKEITAMVARFHVQTVVVGYPVGLAGRVGPQAKKVERFISSLGKVLSGIPITTWDERFSSVAAIKATTAAGTKSGKRHIDKEAAAIVLQSYLDSENFKKDRASE